MKLSELVNETCRASIPWGDDVMNIEYYRHASPAMREKAKEINGWTEEELARRIAAKDSDDGVVLSLALSLASWDVEDEEGNPVPITENLLRRLKDEALIALCKEVFGFNAIPQEPSPSESGLSEGAAANVRSLSTTS